MIKNEYVVTWKLYKEWLIENKKKGAKLIFFLFWSILAIVALVLNFVTGFSPLYLFVIAYCIYRAVFRDYIAAKQQYSQLAKTNGGENWTRTIIISDTETTLKEGPAEYRFDNSDLVRVIEKGDKIWLILKNDKVIRLYKSAFVEGNWESCRDTLKK